MSLALSDFIDYWRWVLCSSDSVELENEIDESNQVDFNFEVLILDKDFNRTFDQSFYFMSEIFILVVWFASLSDFSFD